jgi:hypothetical protein
VHQIWRRLRQTRRMSHGHATLAPIALGIAIAVCFLGNGFDGWLREYDTGTWYADAQVGLDSVSQVDPCHSCARWKPKWAKYSRPPSFQMAIAHIIIRGTHPIIVDTHNNRTYAITKHVKTLPYPGVLTKQD